MGERDILSQKWRFLVWVSEEVDMEKVEGNLLFMEADQYATGAGRNRHSEHLHRRHGMETNKLGLFS